MKERKPLSFGMTMLASALGVVIVSVLSGLVMLIMTIVMLVSMSSSKDVTYVKNNTVLTVNLDQISGDREGSPLMSFGKNSSVGLVDLMGAIRVAANDSKISALLIKDDGAADVSWASFEELRAAIDDFRAAGKPVVSYATSYSTGGYYLCTAAEQVCLHPSGMVDFRGIGAEVMYYKDLLDKLGVEMQLIRPESCAYKSAGEVYTMNHMSDANREQIRAYIGSVWSTAVADIAKSRKMSVEELNRIADDLTGLLADDACANRLVDTLCFEEDVRQMLKNQYGGKQLMGVEKYIENQKAQKSKEKNSIAVIYAEGTVQDGSAKGMDEGVYGDDIVKALRQAMNDDNVKAIVLRVNSPGGQATASESMTHAVIQAKEKKPVIVSMGDLAASAGYEMSCMADVIVAQPMTITGSIGVFGTIPNVQKLMRQKLGLSTDTVSTNRNANGLTAFRPLSPAAMKLMERNVEDFYKVFVGRVAEGRHMTYDAVHEIARGRVWTGADAVKIGLVDTLGGLDLALRIAAEKAGVEHYAVKEYPAEKDVMTQLMELFGEQSDDDLNLMTKVRLAWKWKRCGGWQAVSRVENELRYVGESEGVQALLPFVIMN